MRGFVIPVYKANYSTGGDRGARPYDRQDWSIPMDEQGIPIDPEYHSESQQMVGFVPEHCIDHLRKPQHFKRGVYYNTRSFEYKQEGTAEDR